MADASPNLSCTETNQSEPGVDIEADLQKILNGQHVPVNHIAVGLDRIGNITGAFYVVFQKCDCSHYVLKVSTQTLTTTNGKVLL